MKPPRRARPIGPQPMYRAEDTFEMKVTIAERFLRDDICEEHRLFEIARKGETRFPQSGQIAYEIYQQGKTASTAPRLHPSIIARAERQAAGNRAFLERREAERRDLSIDERLLLATVSMWGHLTIEADDTRRGAIVAALETKGRVAVRRDQDRLIVTLAKTVSTPAV